MAEATVAPGAGVHPEVAAELAQPRLEAILFFDAARQGGGRRTNLLGLLDRLFVAPEERTAPVGVFVRVAGPLHPSISLVITAPDGTGAGSAQFQVPLDQPQGDPRLTRIQVLARVRLSVTEYGLYWFAVRCGGEVIGGSALLVEPGGAGQVQSASPAAPATITLGDADLIEPHPLAPLAGKYEGEEWDGLLEAVRHNREVAREAGDSG